jgi:hypothetical protein
MHKWLRRRMYRTDREIAQGARRRNRRPLVIVRQVEDPLLNQECAY